MIVSWSIFLIPCQFDVEFYLSAFEGKAMTKNCFRLKAFILLRALSAWLRQRLECTWLIGVRGFGKCCANRLPTISNDISGELSIVYIWSFVLSETKTKWNVYCVARQYHDSRYVHWIRRIYTRAVDIATRRGFFHHISHCSKTKFEKGNDQLLKTTSNLFFGPLNGFVYLCLTRSLPF